ncbi:DNA-binding transcriptional regulator, LysR family [Azotobacter beijerinckii]|uniref:DNA-binding transcriptional regulator, LysR family n=1 Tax=Azotobacter beijerinckii TaxID=170623 RepID=A0A1H7A5S2_9GAMM|nr:LysR substrate-binding domain-containing protein [Azotobacter beijerinckii]SEJ60941.1 DNA-binding transcriptional regulator, LysR family [Azotobacter beijerinckii]
MSSPPRPSLNALRAFEMTARKGTFSEAADALAVTHGAISRHIRTLEDLLGVVLLTRNAHGTKLTPEGARLAAGLSRAFALIQESIDEVRPRSLELSCSASIMMQWLLPRLARLHSNFPTMELGLRTGHGPIDFAQEGVSVAIRLDSIEPPPGIVPIPLTNEWIGAICSPDYLAASGVREVSDLSRERLLATKTRPHVWAEWYSSIQQAPAESLEMEFFEHFYLLIQAAKVGLGFACVPRMLVQAELESGALVAPFGFIKGPAKLVLWISPSAQMRPDTAELEKWIREEMADS